MQEAAATKFGSLPTTIRTAFAVRSRRQSDASASKRPDTYEERDRWPMARKKAPSNQGAVWTTKDLAAIRLVKTGATGKTIAKKIGRSVVALHQKASIEGYLAVGAPDGSAIGRSQEGKSRRRIEEASFPLSIRRILARQLRRVLPHS